MTPYAELARESAGEEGAAGVASLDETYYEFNGIYLDANFYKNEFLIFAHLIEVVGGLSAIASEKVEALPQAEKYMPKVMAWWFALAGKIGVRSVEEMLWVKYPGVCPYCTLSPHDERVCKSGPNGPREPQWAVLAEKAAHGQRPTGIAGWQAMFGAIYPLHNTEPMQVVFARLTEELGEMAEAIRVREVAPSYFISEAADVFAWLMKVQAWYDFKTRSEDNKTLERWLAEAYPGKCVECGEATCSCPAILDSAFGRMAHEVPDAVVPKALIPFRDSAARFRARELHFAGKVYPLQGDDMRSLRSGIDELLWKADASDDRWAFQNKAMMDTLYELKNLNSATAISSDLIGRLVTEVQGLQPGAQSELRDMVSGVSSGLFAWLFTMALTGGTGTLH